MTGASRIDRHLLRAALADLRADIASAARRAGRDPESVEVLVAGKYVAASDVAALAAGGVSLVGENRLQDLLAKAALAPQGLVFDFIGHLQRRKVRDVLPLVRLVHSLDSVDLAREISRRAEGTARVLVEVNVAGEPNKHGIAPEALDSFLEDVADLPGLEVGGLMAMPPAVGRPEESRRHFAAMRELRDRLRPAWAGRHDLSALSMGTSQDLLVAVEEGATIVRVGRGLVQRANVG